MKRRAAKDCPIEAGCCIAPNLALLSHLINLAGEPYCVHRQFVEKTGLHMVYTTTTVLVIGENTSACLFMAHALQKAGYRVITSPAEGEGLAMALRVHCLILDVQLPTVEISGFEVCRRLRVK